MRLFVVSVSKLQHCDNWLTWRLYVQRGSKSKLSYSGEYFNTSLIIF